MPHIILKQDATQGEFDALAAAKGLTKLDDTRATLEAPIEGGGYTVYDLFLSGTELVGAAFDVLTPPASPMFREWAQSEIQDFFSE